MKPYVLYVHGFNSSSFDNVTSRSLIARATKKRILKRCPQSDLSLRFQRCIINNNGKILPKNSQIINFQKFDSVNNSNESMPSHIEGFFNL